MITHNIYFDNFSYKMQVAFLSVFNLTKTVTLTRRVLKLALDIGKRSPSHWLETIVKNFKPLDITDSTKKVRIDSVIWLYPGFPLILPKNSSGFRMLPAYPGFRDIEFRYNEAVYRKIRPLQIPNPAQQPQSILKSKKSCRVVTWFSDTV